MSDDMSNMKNSSRDYAKKNVSARTAQDMLRIASERLSTVRYVFIVHIESGIPSAAWPAPPVINANVGYLVPN